MMGDQGVLVRGVEVMEGFRAGLLSMGGGEGSRRVSARCVGCVRSA